MIVEQLQSASDSIHAVLEQAREENRTILTAPECKVICDAYDIPVPQERLALNEAEAMQYADVMGYPVVLKIVSPDIVHKTEAGALMLGVSGEAAVRDGYRTVLTRAKAAHPDAKIDGVLVQAMAKRGQEMIIGVTRDPTFGPLLMVGLGGIYVEVLRDVAFAPVPLGVDDALALLDELKGAALLKGVRGEKPADRVALAELVSAVSRFAADHADAVAEIDLNPVIVHPEGEGVSVVDALIVRR